MEAKIVAAVYSRALSRPAVVVSHLTTHNMHIYYGLLPGHNVDRTKKSVREMKQPTLVCSYWVRVSITNCWGLLGWGGGGHSVGGPCGSIEFVRGLCRGHHRVKAVAFTIPPGREPSAEERA